MAIVPQNVSATADIDGDATFLFPDVPQGELWSGTTSIPLAPSDATSLVTTGGLLVGAMHGPGVYGPWTVDYSRRLAISSSGLAPGTQYEAVWHADSKGSEFSTYPATITTSVAGTVDIPQPVQVDVLGVVPVDQASAPWAVDVTNFPNPQPVSGTVLTEPALASSVTSGQRTMVTGTALPGPNLPATQGVIVASDFRNTSVIGIGGTNAVTAVTGLILNPGQMTPVLPVTNADVLWVAGNNNTDVVSFLVV